MTLPRFSRRAVLAVLCATATLGAHAGTNTFIENHYARRGPAEVVEQVVNDEAGKPLYVIYAPAQLGDNHPIVTWGNGTGAQPVNYAELLSHLASWGFVAIDNYKRNTGTGREILDAALFLVAQNQTPGSPLRGHLDVGAIASAGHSQGATGAINAATRHPESAMIRSVVPIALPNQSDDQVGNYDTSLLTVPLFIMGGTQDKLISPRRTNVAAFNKTPDTLPAAMALRRMAGHNEIQPDGGRHRGYLTAWLRFQLRNDPLAALAFSTPAAELLRNPDWTSADTQRLR